jgi:leader peptidase (prepilin peptidase)/N-methyltransferase
MTMAFSVFFAAILGLASTRPLTAAVRAHTPPNAPALAFAASGLLALLAAGQRPLAVTAVLAALTVLGVALAAVDAAVHRLPDALVLPAWPLTATALALTGDHDALLRALAASAVCLAVYAAVHLTAPAALGFGDVKLAALLGLPLGWLSWPTVATATVTTLALGAAWALIAARAGRTHIPYGPSMLLGAHIAVLIGLPAPVPRPGTRRSPADRSPPPA